MDPYDVTCTCGRVEFRLAGAPRVRGHCHCDACRTLLNVPYHSVTAWNDDQLSILRGREMLVEFQHPTLAMTKVICSGCGDVLWNTNMMGWRVVSQHFIRRSLGILPADLTSLSHFHYGKRIVDVADGLPKRE